MAGTGHQLAGPLPDYRFQVTSGARRYSYCAASPGQRHCTSFNPSSGSGSRTRTSILSSVFFAHPAVLTIQGSLPGMFGRRRPISRPAGRRESVVEAQFPGYHLFFLRPRRKASMAMHTHRVNIAHGRRRGLLKKKPRGSSRVFPEAAMRVTQPAISSPESVGRPWDG